MSFAVVPECYIYVAGFNRTAGIISYVIIGYHPGSTLNGFKLPQIINLILSQL